MEKRPDMGGNASLDSTGKRKSFRRLCVRFAEKTSLQGIGYINNARLIGAKIVWVVLLLGAIGGMVFHLYFLFDQYLKWPVTTRISMGFSNLEMPAITICNTNVVKRSELKLMDTRLQDFVSNTDKALFPPGTPSKLKTTFASGLSDVNASADGDSTSNGTNDGVHTENLLVQQSKIFRNLFMDNIRSNRINSGHRLSDMLLSCTFDSQNECSYADFALYPTAEYGNCYTLKAQDFVATKPGQEFGLSLILYMQTEDYIHGITSGYGARVIIHQKDTIPFPLDNGVFVSSSFESAISLKLMDVTRLSTPYGTCNFGTDFHAMYNITYNRQTCHVICEQNAIISACNCIPSDQDMQSIISDVPDYLPCTTISDNLCQWTVRDEIAQETISCDCDKACREQVYAKTISSRRWPSEDYSVALTNSVCEKPNMADECAKLRSLDKHQLSVNFLKLDIYYESLNYEEVEETPEIETAQFISDVGGALGLWIGLSILSIFELIQLFVECCNYTHHRCKNRDARRVIQAKTNSRNHRDQSNGHFNHSKPKMAFNSSTHQNDRVMEHGRREHYSDIGSARQHDTSYPRSLYYGEGERGYLRKEDGLDNGSGRGRYETPGPVYVYRGQHW